MIQICVWLAVAVVGFYFAFRPRRDPTLARGVYLDRLAALYGLKRSRWESDKKLRARCMGVHRGIDEKAAKRGPPAWLLKMTGRDEDGRGPQ